MSAYTHYLLENTSISPVDQKHQLYEKGQFVSTNHCGIILEGVIQVYSVSSDGSTTLLSELHQNDCFGISTLCSSNEVHTILKCAQNCHVLCISKERIIQEINHNPSFSLKLIALYSSKVQFLLNRIEQLTIQSARKKLALYLLNTSTENPIIELNSREDIAHYIGISRASLFRELSFFKQHDIISLLGSTLTIIDRKALIFYS